MRQDFGRVLIRLCELSLAKYETVPADFQIQVL